MVRVVTWTMKFFTYSILLVMSQLPVNAEWIDEGGIQWDCRINNGAIEICGANDPHFSGVGVSGAISIPSVLSGYPVTSICDYAFQNYAHLTNVSIPNSVMSIGKGAFLQSSIAGNISIPNSVKSIGDQAFKWCSYLEEVKIGNGVVSIGDSAFANCGRLASLSIGSSVKNIGPQAFASCSRLATVVIPDNVVSIDWGAFRYCRGLTNLVISKNVTSIEYEAFAYCDNLAHATIPDGVVNIGRSAFRACFNLDSVTIPNCVTCIGYQAFEGCAKLTNVTIPNKVVNLGLNAFAGCDELAEICFKGAPPNIISSNGNILYNVNEKVKDLPCNGTYTAANAAEWNAVIDANGYWHGLKMQMSPSDVVVHFNANGGVFRDKDGNEVTQFDQYFSYGEAQRLFTDELTPMKMDADGNQFVGWVRESPEVTTGSSIVAAREERTWHEHDGVTEVTYYAVWTTTVTVSFYNDTDVNSGNRILSPGSLGNHLSWSVDDDAGRYKGGESVQVLPGQRIIRLYVDDEYHWIAGRFDLGSYESGFHRAYDYLELNIGNDFRDVLVYGSTPREYGHHIYVKVEPDINQPEAHGEVVFFYEAAVREGLRSLINAQRGNVPAFDISKVRISIGKTAVNQSGNVVEDSAHGLTGLELHKYYCLPTGLYYLKDVVYDADASSGDPYWGAVLDSTFENLLFEVKDSRFTERTIDFDVFGGRAAVRVVFDPQGGECAKSEMWLLYHGTPYSNSGWISIDKKTAESLPTPEKGEDFKFLGWFTERSGGLEFKSGAAISGDKVHWILPFEHTFYAYAQWTNMADYWMYLFPDLVAASGGDIVTAAKMPAANGCRTVGECYALGINPEDPNDDLKITDFKMENGKPVIMLNHTEDGSGNSFEPRIKTLGKTNLTDEDWVDVTDKDQSAYRFFKVKVDMP